MIVKVKIGTKRPVYLELAKYIEKGGLRFVSGYQIDSSGEPVIVHGAEILHLIQLGEGVSLTEMTFDLKYGNLIQKKVEAKKESRA